MSVGEPSYQHDPPWGYDTLEITSSQQEILETAKASGKPIVTVVTGGRPYILTWCDENTNAILEAYYPGPVSYTHLDVYKRQAPWPAP